MRQRGIGKLAGLLALSCGILLSGSFISCSIADDAAPAEKSVEKKTTASNDAAPEKKKAKKFSGRLPVFYGEVVSGEQREKIYSIQLSYADRMADLVAQVKALQAAQMAEVEAVLSDEQKKKVEDLRAEALAKRKSKETATKTDSKTDSKTSSK